MPRPDPERQGNRQVRDLAQSNASLPRQSPALTRFADHTFLPP